MMEIAANLARIKDNLLLIPAERFDSLTKDPGYLDSFIYLAFCLLVSSPLDILIALAQGESLAAALIGSAILFAVAFPVVYIVYALQFLLLRLLGGKGSFLVSVQVFVYGSTLSLILGEVPCIGFAASLISLSNIVVGSARVHQISLLRALLALLVIPVAVVVAIAVIFVLISGISESGAPLLQPG